MEKRGPGRKNEIVNGRVNQAEITLIEVGKQHHVANAAVTTVGSATPGRLGFDWNHAAIVQEPDTLRP